MPKRIIAALGLLLGSLSAHPQTIKLLSAGSHKPVPDVQIHSERHSAVTNNQGKASIAAFADTAVLHFTHINYVPRSIRKNKIMKSGKRVYLQKQIIDLNEVIVSASRWEQKKNEVPNKITTVNQPEIALKNPQTAADLLGLTGEVYIQKSQLGGGSPMIRGFATSRVLLVIDGVRMNNAIFRSGNLQNVISLDAHNIGNSEVIFGPGSVIYGSDAIGGVMDFHTENIPLSGKDQKLVNVNEMVRHSTANNERTAHINVKASNGNWGIYTAITNSHYSDLRMGSNGNPGYKRNWMAKRINGRDTMVQNPHPNIQRYSGYEQTNILQKIKYRFTDKLSTEYAFHYSATSDIPRYDRLIVQSGDKPKYAAWHYGPQKWQMHSLTTRYTGQSSLFDNATLTAAWQNYQESRHDRKFGEKFLRHRNEEVDMASVNLDMDKSAGSHYFYYGLEAVYNKVHSEASLEDITSGAQSPYASRYPDGATYEYLSAYLAYKNNITSQISLNAGVRLNQHRLHAAFDTAFYNFPFKNMKLNHGAMNGNLGIVYRMPKGWHFSANFSTGFKAPNVDDAGKVFDSEPGTVIVPNKNLKSEYAYNGELQVAKSWQQRNQINIAFFYTLLDRAMVRREFTFNGRDSIMYDGQLSQVKSLVNAKQATVYGFQAGTKVNLPHDWYLTGHINWTYGATGDGTPMRHVAPIFGDIHLKWRHEGLIVDSYAKFNGKKAHEDMAPSELGKPHMYAKNEDGDLYSPAWYTLNLKMRWRISASLQLSGGVENILDKRYRLYASGICAPGRNFIVALRGYFSH